MQAKHNPRSQSGAPHASHRLFTQPIFVAGVDLSPVRQGPLTSTGGPAAGAVCASVFSSWLHGRLRQDTAEPVRPTCPPNKRVKRTVEISGDGRAFQNGAWIAGRYVVQGRLGQGGMGTVYRVFDESTGKTLALKQLLKERAAGSSQSLVLFQREYHTLVQLAHPLIMEVYDYGVDRGGPYYTMELLGGSDLRALSPMDWKRACALLRDVAFSLAIVHSRHLVHRDVTPRNVRCTENGRAKLMDFGAMVPMGPVKRVVGTPPYVPPEAINRQPLDGRADLFSLGALAYWLLIGRNAYPARKLEKLRDAWRSRIPNPTGLVPEIPEALSSLVMSLLNLDRLARPINAPEVIDRLSAIAGLPEDESLGVCQAYLTTPNLVGRAKQLTRCRKHVLNGVRRNGSVLAIRGAPGMGRSRLLMACMLDAKVVGAAVASATAEDAREGAYGVVRALVNDLLETMPKTTMEVAAEYRDALGHVMPELYGAAAGPASRRPTDDGQTRPLVQEAIREFLISLAGEHSVLIAVDDVDRCDEQSAAVLAALSRDAHKLPLTLAVTMDPSVKAGPASNAVKMIKDVGSFVTIRGLDRQETEQLMGSVFGDVPNKSLLADWVYGLSQGNPRTCMDLAQHLVDNGIARYEGGQWVLPDNLQGQALPQSLEQALDARIDSLSDAARALAETLSLVTDHAWRGIGDCIALWHNEDPHGVFGALNELVAAQVLAGTQDAYVFSQTGLVQALHRRLDEKRRRQVHAELARAYQSVGYDNPWVIIYHLQQGGQAEPALDRLLPLVETTGAAVGSYALQVQCCELGLALAEKLQRSPREVYFIRKALILLASRYDANLLRHASAADAQLHRDSGLVFWERLNGLEPVERIQRCLQMAQSEWESLPKVQRGLSPTEAVKEFAIYSTFVTSACGCAQDAKGLAKLWALVAPLGPLAPAIALLVKLLGNALRALRGQRVAERYLEMEESLQQDVPGMTDVVRERTRHVISYTVALNAIQFGEVEPALKRADILESHPSFVTNAWQIRMLAQLLFGNAEEAERCRERFELSAVQNPESDSHTVHGLVFEATPRILSGDLMGLKRLLVSIRRLTMQLPGWAPFLLTVRGEYHRLRGELKQAATDLQDALKEIAPGQHHAWSRATIGLIRTLVDLGKAEQARTLALRALEQCERHEVQVAAVREVSCALALAEARLGRHSEAAMRVQTLIEEATARCLAPLLLGNLHETRAVVAMEAHDERAFTEHAELTAKHYRPGRNPALIARYEKLLMDAHRVDLAPDSQLEAAINRPDDIGSTGGTTGTLLPDN